MKQYDMNAGLDSGGDYLEYLRDDLVNTPIMSVIKEFEELKSKAESLKDVIYLDGVLSVLQNYLKLERDQLVDFGIELMSGDYIHTIKNNHDLCEYVRKLADRRIDIRNNTKHAIGDIHEAPDRNIINDNQK